MVNPKLFQLSHHDRVAAAKGVLYAQWCATQEPVSDADVIRVTRMWSTSDVDAAEAMWAVDEFESEVAQLDFWLLFDTLNDWLGGFDDEEGDAELI
jgi:hypothetical protein